MEPATGDDLEAVDAVEVVVYWRPGCGHCGRLRRSLDRRGVRYRAVDIWSDPVAADTVRLITGGPETVPTVTVGPTSLVHPRVDDVVAVVRELAPSLLADPDGDETSTSGTTPRHHVRRRWPVVFGLRATRPPGRRSA